MLEVFLPIVITDNGIRFQGFSGFASHGAAVGIIVSVYLFCKKYKRQWLESIDLLSVAVSLGGAMIRLGNFFNSEIVGKATTCSLGVIFARNDNILRHPAQLYEAFGYILIAIASYYIFNAFIKKGIYRQKIGFLTGFFVSGIFLLRFFIEYIKESQNTLDLQIVNSIGLNIGQLLSIPFVVIFGGLMIYAYRKK